MTNKKFLILILVIVILGLVLGYFMGNTGGDGQNKESTDVTTAESKADTQTVETVTRAPTLTFAPLAQTVKSISDDKIIAQGDGGEMVIPKDPQMVKVYQRIGSELKRVNFEDVKIGQKITLKIITPGKDAQLIIEQ